MTREMAELKDGVEREAGEIARGRRWYTPFTVVGAVALVAWGAAALLIGIVALVWLLA
ncbi:MAG: hypothetical protein ABR583_05175 [Gaiellaceae bacterium]